MKISSTPGAVRNNKCHCGNVSCMLQMCTGLRASMGHPLLLLSVHMVVVACLYMPGRHIPLHGLCVRCIGSTLLTRGAGALWRAVVVPPVPTREEVWVLPRRVTRCAQHTQTCAN